MSLIDTALTTDPRYYKGHLYVRPPRPIEFPAYEPPEEEVSETKRHLENRTALYLVLKDAFAATSSIGSDQFVYWDPKNGRRCLSPDVFVKLGAPDQPFGVWKTWERAAPDVAIEIVSESDQRDEDWEEKLARYRDAGILEIVRFDAEDARRPIRIWDSVSGDLVERAADDPDRLSCRALGLWWIILQDPTYGPMLRLSRDREGRELLPTPSEGRVLAEVQLREARRAQLEAEHAKLVAEQEKVVAEQEKLVTEQKLRDETEALRRAQREIEELKAALARRQQ